MSNAAVRFIGEDFPVNTLSQFFLIARPAEKDLNYENK